MLKEILDNIIVYHTTDKNVKLVLPEEDYDKLEKAILICENILSKVKLGIFAEQNEYLKTELEKTPALTNYCIMYKLSKEEYESIQESLKNK